MTIVSGGKSLRDGHLASDDGRESAGQGARGVTPVMAQYIEIKAANPDCLLFYRMGDFYELFFEDAEIASRALGIVLTKRGKHHGADIAMCGVPAERADDYLRRLIALGHRVAVCEQMEDPAQARKRGSKAVVRRDVVRLVTPGTVTEERLLDPSRASTLLAVTRVRASEEDWLYGLAAADISTGAFHVSESTEAGLAAEIARIEPREIVVPDVINNEPGLRALLSESRAAVTLMARDSSDGAAAERRVRDYFGVETLDGFGVFSRAEVSAAAAAIAYVERTQIGARPNLMFPSRAGRGMTLEIDAATRANLELTRTLGGERSGSLLSCIDATRTPAGGRLLAERLAAPLTDPGIIAERLACVAFFLDDAPLRQDIRDMLSAAPDMARAMARLTLDRGGPRDLASLNAGIEAATAIAARLSGARDLPRDIVEAAKSAGSIDPALPRALRAALDENPPLHRREGGFVRPGFDSELDAARALRDESRRVIASLQGEYVERTQTKQLKIKHNNFLGFFIEVPQAQGERLLRPPLDAEFTHRQTMADAMRFSTPELARLEAEIASAADRALALELAIFDDLAKTALAARAAIRNASDALARIDVCAALAEIAAQRSWTCPEVDASLTFAIEGGRHPVVESALKARGVAFVSNDCNLTADAGAAEAGRVAIVTGPNMAGKSTYLRQNALIAVLAQMGSYVPARRARLGILDKLFSRVGAADDLARGRSTFMVEMVETAAILNQATPRSLVILDEIGRGTATFDGLSIAWAAIEHLHDANRSRALFATHFHELTQLTRSLPRLLNLTMRVADWQGGVVFLHEIVPGAADRSYGIQVAKLAGLPASVVARAKVLLAELEASDRQAPVQRMIDDLPLFSAALPPPPPQRKEDPLRKALEEIRPDELTPRAALDIVYALKRAMLEEGG